LLSLALASLHLPLASLQPFQLAVKVFFFALVPLLLLGDARAQIADLRLGLISQS
jgi:hypothetical protein